MKRKNSKLQLQLSHQACTAHTRPGGPARIAAILLIGLTGSAFGAPPWSPPVTLSQAAVFAQAPTVAINDSGAMVAAWARQQGFVYNVQAAVNTNGTWSSAVNLSAAGQTAIGPSVAIDSNGVATAVWTTTNMVQASTLLPGGSWSAPVAVSDVGLSVLAPQVVVDAAGNATAMWVRYDNAGVPALETADRPAGGNWSTPLFLAAGAPGDFTLVVNAAGDVAAIWNIGSFISSTGVYSSNRPFGAVWSAPYTMAPPAYRQGGGRISIAANGDLTACWRTNTEIRVADKPAAGSWGATQTLYTSVAVSEYPTLAVTPSGDAMAAWITYVFVGSTYNYQIRTSVRPLGRRWSKPALLTGRKENDGEAHAATTPGGSFVLTWVDSNRFTIKSSTRTAATPWSPLAIISSGSDTALAVSGNTALAIWMGGSFQATVSTLAVSP